MTKEEYLQHRCATCEEITCNARGTGTVHDCNILSDFSDGWDACQEQHDAIWHDASVKPKYGIVIVYYSNADNEIKYADKRRYAWLG